jgi:hypothetical protein
VPPDLVQKQQVLALHQRLDDPAPPGGFTIPRAAGKDRTQSNRGLAVDIAKVVGTYVERPERLAQRGGPRPE